MLKVCMPFMQCMLIRCVLLDSHVNIFMDNMVVFVVVVVVCVVLLRFVVVFHVMF